MNKLLTRFIKPATAQALKILAWVVALANVPLTIGATITGVPAWLNWLTPWWPAIYGVALALHSTASTFGITPDAGIQALLNSLNKGVITAEQIMGALRGASTPQPSNSTAQTASRQP